MRAIWTLTACVVLGILRASPSVAAQAAYDAGWDRIITRFEPGQPGSLPPIAIPEVYELASVIVALTPDGAANTQPSAYRDAVAAHFAQFRSHPLIARLAIEKPEDGPKRFDFRENASAFCFSGDELIVHCQPYSHAWGRLANMFVRNLGLVEDFARVSDFRRFYAQHQPFYAQLVRRYAEAVPLAAMQDWLNARFVQTASFQQIIFSPLTGGWHSTQQYEDEGRRLLVMYIQPLRDKEPTPWSAAQVVFTELDHNYVNPASERHARRIEPAFGSFWAKPGSPYKSGSSVFNEHMTYAVFELWALETYGAVGEAEVAERSAALMERRGFPHYRSFAREVRRLYAGQGPKKSVPALYPPLLDWADRYRGAR